MQNKSLKYDQHLNQLKIHKYFKETTLRELISSCKDNCETFLSLFLWESIFAKKPTLNILWELNLVNFARRNFTCHWFSYENKKSVYKAKQSQLKEVKVNIRNF